MALKSLKKSKPFLWIVDPWAKLAPHPIDTTLRFGEESLRMGLRSFFTDVKTLRLEGDRLFFTAREMLESRAPRGPNDFTFGKPYEAVLSDFRQIHYRVDPPVDLGYLHPLQMVALHAAPEKVEVVNPPPALFGLNEKFIISSEPSLSPASIITADRDALLKFGKREGKVVLKPLHQAMSKGVKLIQLKEDSARAEADFREASANFTLPIILQRYLSGIEVGETRLWFVDGKLLDHARKCPLKGDFRVDIDLGSAVEAVALTARDKKAIPKIQKILRAHKIRLAAVDLIDGKVTDFNFTSPGLITHMEDLSGRNLSREILTALSKPFA